LKDNIQKKYYGCEEDFEIVLAYTYCFSVSLKKVFNTKE